MTTLWLIVWLFNGFPQVNFVTWNSWAVSLAVCAFISIIRLLTNLSGDKDGEDDSE